MAHATSRNGLATIQWGETPVDLSDLMRADANVEPYFTTPLGALFSGDCIAVLPNLQDECIDTVFADPPFNLDKEYGARSNDILAEDAYLDWCHAWLDECIRVLKPGGALFVYNLPKWNIPLGNHLMKNGLQFKHWIAVVISACLPILVRLHPSHYSLLYFTKDIGKTFRRVRTPVPTYRHCGGEIKDYGGHRKALNPKGIYLKDVWTVIPPVRHSKFKSGNRKANALSTKMLDRVVEISTVPGEVILDPISTATIFTPTAYHRTLLLAMSSVAPPLPVR